MRLSPEFRLVAACCRWPPSQSQVLGEADGVDWALVLRIAQRHRVEGLVHSALCHLRVDVPKAEGEQLRLAAAQISRQNLVLAGESLRLTKRLAAAGVPHLFVKGVSLGALCYGTIAIKQGWDIDLLVPFEAVRSVADILEEAGYGLALPEGPKGRERIDDWHRYWKESVWRIAGTAVYLEAHTRLSDNPMLLPTLDTTSPFQSVEIGKGKSLPTLATDELFAYLCVHGASSAWFRLKWIADVAALIGSREPDEISRLYRRSQELGAGRAAAQALLLCERLFGTPVPPALAAELAGKRINRWLTAIALRKLAGRTAATELHDARFGTATIHFMQLALLPGLRFKLSELGRQLVDPADRLAVTLPQRFHFLYPVISLLRRLDPRARLGKGRRR